MTETLHSYAQSLDWYRTFGVDAALSDVPRNHYVETTPVKLSFKPMMKAASLPAESISPAAAPRAHPFPAPDASAMPQTSFPTPSPTPSRVVTNTPDFTQPIATSGDHPALACETLDQLRYAMEHATGCDLIKAATHTVFADGNPNANIMLIGEAPGADEDRLGQPFVGQSGQLLDTILATIGVDRGSIYISNIIPWRPPGNRPPTAAEAAYCLPFIQRHIELVSPKILILLGGVAVKALLNRGDGILKLRGQILEYTTKSGSTIAAMPTLHPSYIMRSPSQKALVWKDMLTLKAWLAGH